MQESNSHGDGPGQGAQGVRDSAAIIVIPRSGIGDCEAQEQPQRTWAEERQQLVSWVATAGAIWRWKGKWKRKTGIGTVDSLSLGWHVTLVEAWVGIVDFAHKSYQSESGYEALLDEAFRLRLDWELCSSSLRGCDDTVLLGAAEWDRQEMEDTHGRAEMRGQDEGDFSVLPGAAE